MILEDQIKLRFETFVYHESNTENEDLKRCKNANKYFFDNKTGLEVTCSMILKMQKPLCSILPPVGHDDHESLFERLNDIVRQCKGAIKDIENKKLSL